MGCRVAIFRTILPSAQSGASVLGKGGIHRSGWLPSDSAISHLPDATYGSSVPLAGGRSHHIPKGIPLLGFLSLGQAPEISQFMRWIYVGSSLQNFSPQARGPVRLSLWWQNASWQKHARREGRFTTAQYSLPGHASNALTSFL